MMWVYNVSESGAEPSFKGERRITHFTCVIFAPVLSFEILKIND